MKNRVFTRIVSAALGVFFSTYNAAFAQSSHIAEIKTVAVKFILAMLGVALFSILIFVGLSLYNRFFVASQIKDFNLSKDSLRTPIDTDEAILSFITKNRLK